MTDKIELTQDERGPWLDSDGKEWVEAADYVLLDPVTLQDDDGREYVFATDDYCDCEYDGSDLRDLRAVFDLPEIRSAVESLGFYDKAHVERALGLRPA